MIQQKQNPSTLKATLVSEGSDSVDRREQFLVGLLSSTDDGVHTRIVKAYRAGKTVEAAEIELRNIIDEIIHED